MRARVIITSGDPSLAEGFAQLTRDVLVPSSQQQPGYRGYVAFVDADGTATAVTLWEDEAAEEASDATLREAREGFAKAFGVDLRVVKADVAFAEVR